MIDSFDIEIGCGELNFATRCIDQNVGQDRDGVPAFYDVLDMSKRILERAAFDRQSHLIIPLPVIRFCPRVFLSRINESARSFWGAGR